MNAPRLLRRASLLPGESLSSLLERLTELNYYSRSYVFNWICQEYMEHPTSLYDLTRSKQAEVFSQLAQLAGGIAEELFVASEHRFSPVLTTPEQVQVFMVWLDGKPRQVATTAIRDQHIRVPSFAQFCPLCLKESAYHRLSWIPVASAICLAHKCLLSDRCPQCGKRLSVAEIVRRQCKACKTDPSEAYPVNVADDELGIFSQRVIQSWLLDAPIPALQPNAVLASQPSNVLYRFLDGLRLSLLTCQDDWHNLPAPLNGLPEQVKERCNPAKKMHPTDAYYLYRAAFNGVLNWPHGFYEFLDAYGQRDHLAQTSTCVTKRLGMLWLYWSRYAWRHPAFEFIQRTLVDYLLDRHIPVPYTMCTRFKDISWFVQRTGLWTEEQAAQELGISTQALSRFFLSRYSLPGLLERCFSSQSTGRTRIFDRDSVLEVKKAWREGLPMIYACYCLGLSEQEVVGLIELGALVVVSGLNSNDYSDWILDLQSVETFFNAVADQLKLYQGNPADLEHLFLVAPVTSDVGIDIPVLLKCIADGTILAYKRQPLLRSLSHVYFLTSMIQTIPDLIYAKQEWVSGHCLPKEWKSRSRSLKCESGQI